jgi:O-antigen/teichoic acid export membrane protein
MSFKKNTLANYFGQIYITFIGIVILPFYLRYLGAAAFGLIGLFVMLQSWLRLLDMGLSPAFARQVAYVRGKEFDLFALKRLLRSLELIFLVGALFIVITMGFASHWIARSWLQVQGLSIARVALCVFLMGMIIGLRWFSDLYQNGIRGMEDQVWLNMLNIFMVSLQYLGGWTFLHWVSHDPLYFFEYQLLVSGFNLLVLGRRFYQSIPQQRSVGMHISWSAIKEVLPFAGATAYLAVVWIIITQLDKLVLSNILPLTEYGYFSLVVVVSNGMLMLMGPINQAILPRMTYLLAQGREADMLVLYRQATQIMAIVMFALTGMLAVFAPELLYAWTGDRAAAAWASPILFWYVLGNGFLSMLTFQYYLQYAHGKLRLNVVINTISAFITVPLVLFAAYHYGAWGTAFSWFLIKAVSFFIWVPLVHRFYAPGLHWKWLGADVLPVLLATLVVMTIFRTLPLHFEWMNRFEILLSLFMLGLLVLLSNALVSNVGRSVITTFGRKIIRSLKWN